MSNKMSQVTDLLLGQLHTLSVRDNFNNDDGTFNSELLETELKVTRGMLDITDTLLNMTKTQLEIEKARHDYLLDRKTIPLMLMEGPSD